MGVLKGVLLTLAMIVGMVAAGGFDGDMSSRGLTILTLIEIILFACMGIVLVKERM